MVLISNIIIKATLKGSVNIDLSYNVVKFIGYVLLFIIIFYLYSKYNSDTIYCFTSDREVINNVKTEVHLYKLSIPISDIGISVVSSNLGLGVCITVGMVVMYKVASIVSILGKVGVVLLGGIIGGFMFTGFSNLNRQNALEAYIQHYIINNKSVVYSLNIPNSLLPLDELLGDTSPLYDILYSIYIISFIGVILFVYLIFILLCKIYIKPDKILLKISNNNKFYGYMYKILLSYNKFSNLYVIYLLSIILCIIVYIFIMSYNLYINLDDYIAIVNKFYNKK